MGDKEKKDEEEKMENQEKVEKVPIWKKVTLTIEEAAAYSSIGICTLKELMRNPKCPFVLYIGRRRLIKRKEFEQFISNTLEI